MLSKLRGSGSAVLLQPDRQKNTDLRGFSAAAAIESASGPDRGHGHGLYAQNQTGTLKIKDNIIFSAFGSGIHNYGSEIAYFDNIHMEGNVCFNNGILAGGPIGFSVNLLIGGGRIAQNPRVINNAMYYPVGLGGQNMDIGYGGPGVNNAIVRGNYLGGGDVRFNRNNSNVTMTDNFFYTDVPPNLLTRRRAPPRGLHDFARSRAGRS